MTTTRGVAHVKESHALSALNHGYGLSLFAELCSGLQLTDYTLPFQHLGLCITGSYLVK